MTVRQMIERQSTEFGEAERLSARNSWGLMTDITEREMYQLMKVMVQDTNEVFASFEYL